MESNPCHASAPGNPLPTPFGRPLHGQVLDVQIEDRFRQLPTQGEVTPELGGHGVSDEQDIATGWDWRARQGGELVPQNRSSRPVRNSRKTAHTGT
jgi:hypothetical protein